MLNKEQIATTIAATIAANKIKKNTVRDDLSNIDHASPAGAELLNVIAQSNAAEQNRKKPCHCQSCGAIGYPGGYPFSTIGGGICDDCI